ncbi:3-deoxy-D-manno-octulosonic acid transferase [Ulvibacter antarcticus]|nr:glycosyltransferase N-terminal domain-containing protein [Ulvibacter antarcticus]
MRLFMQGRKGVFETLLKQIDENDKTIWFHCASLGEFEQGVPIIEAVKVLLPKYKIVISFFSPSGFEVKKNTSLADVVVYLPLDTRSNAKKFIEAVHPSLAVFVKYEFWPNYLFELEKANIPTLLVSGLFRPEQVFFKSYGSFMRKALGSFDHIFIQNESSKDLLAKLDITKTTMSGDTRFDRVSHQIEQDNTIEWLQIFKGDTLCIVCGSTWPKDEAVLLDYINASEGVKFVIAPHKIDERKIEAFRSKINKNVILYSELKSEGALSEASVLESAAVFIIDIIGLLTKIYSYADIAYVGGAMGKTGLHNILEPATFGIPVIIGKNFDDFPEAKRLQQLAGLFSVSNSEECTQVLSKLVKDNSFRSKTGMIAGHFINNNTGATKKVLAHIENLHRDGLI